VACIASVYFIKDICVRYWALRAEQPDLSHERVPQVIAEWKDEKAIYLWFHFQLRLSSVLYLIALGGLPFPLMVSMNNRTVWYNCKGGKWFFQIKNKTKQNKNKRPTEFHSNFLGFAISLPKPAFIYRVKLMEVLSPLKIYLSLRLY